MRKKMARVPTPSSKQVTRLIEFMEEKSSLARGHARTASARKHVQNAWDEIGEVLNSMGSECSKTGKQWCKYWKDKKGSLKQKMNKIALLRQRMDPDVDEIPELTPTEQRIVFVMGWTGYAADADDGHLLPSTLQESYDLSSEAPPMSPSQTRSRNGRLENYLEYTRRCPKLHSEAEYIVVTPELNPQHAGGFQGMSMKQEQDSSADGSEVDMRSNRMRRWQNNIQRRHNTRQSIQQQTVNGNPPQRRTTRDATKPANSLARRLLAIEERRTKAELIHAKSFHIFARSQEKMAERVEELAQAFASHAEALNALVDLLREERQI